MWVGVDNGQCTVYCVGGGIHVYVDTLVQVFAIVAETVVFPYITADSKSAPPIAGFVPPIAPLHRR